MIPSFRSFPPEAAANLVALFFDIDDTFSSRGKITAEAYRALWSLKESGIRSLPITGRPAGWCDHIARMWPVDGVVGENGAFYFFYDENEGRLRKRFFDPDPLRRENRRRLDRIREEILSSVPGTALASDQVYREADLAIDYCEDVPPLPRSEVDRICGIFERHGARCKVSSIHVNGWFGDYDKLHMVRAFVLEQWGWDLDACKDRFLFCGDSPNDEPMFRYFPYSAGVKNVLRFTDRMVHVPTYVADEESGKGFVEIVDTILAQRSP
ncbi:MAG: HAD-IIB family hydrolase [Deltaproteobacteria bacterium]|nr:HAD-IIB family hydrolase [Deltaproteobacteria bacterium]